MQILFTLKGSSADFRQSKQTVLSHPAIFILTLLIVMITPCGYDSDAQFSLSLLIPPPYSPPDLYDSYGLTHLPILVY
jgi:hypothetical protein